MISATMTTLMSSDKSMVMMTQNLLQYEERRNRLFWLLTFMLAVISTILFLSYVNKRRANVEIDNFVTKSNDWPNVLNMDVNNRPIIGILTQELDDVLTAKLPNEYQGKYSAYLASSYVQWIMSGGARVVPIIIGKDEEYYRKIFDGINGLLLPGGSAPLSGPGGYASVGGLFYQWAKEANDHGDFFPIWGTCNGFELLTVLSSKDTSRLTECDSQDQAVPLNFYPDAENSNLFRSAPPDVIREIKQERITINFHNHCLTPTNFTRFGMDKFWNPLSWNWDRLSLEYISSIEAIKYPFIGVQFHPEKNIFEWSEKEPRIPHSRHAVHVSLYFASHFVNMARRNQHGFQDRYQEEQFLSYNYSPHFVGKYNIGWLFEEAYLF